MVLYLGLKSTTHLSRLPPILNSAAGEKINTKWLENNNILVQIIMEVVYGTHDSRVFILPPQTGGGEFWGIWGGVLISGNFQDFGDSPQSGGGGGGIAPLVALADEQVLARNMIVEGEHPLGGKVKMPGNPAKLSDHEDSFGPPPLLGQHTSEVLRDMLGMKDADIDALKKADTIQ